jgi:superfamily II DNA/RNA helicase
VLKVEKAKMRRSLLIFLICTQVNINSFYNNAILKSIANTQNNFNHEMKLFDNFIFAGIKMPLVIAESLQKLNIQHPTPIQTAAVAPLTSGLSCILHSETGSGKTLCYLLPILKRLAQHVELSTSTQALIVVPTKELAIQVFLLKFMD